MKSIDAKYSLVLLISLMIDACGAQPTVRMRCIPPSTNFAYQADSTGIGNYPANEIPPSPPWIVESRMPYASTELLAARTIDQNYTEIWISEFSPETNSPYYYEYHVYNTDTKEWKTISLEEGLNRSSPLSALYFTSDDSVWAFHDAGSTRTSIPILSKYDASINSFVFVREIEDLPNGILAEGHIRYRTQVLLDEKNVFWILAPDDFIYSFEPDTGLVKRHISIQGKFPSDATLTPDGRIYFLDKSGSEDQLFRYSPQTNGLQSVYYGLETRPRIPNILADHSGNLWAGGLGWMETDGTWYQILRSPLFVTTRLELDGGRVYRWQQPSILMESSDYRLWFVSANGTFSLDPKKGEWCWFSTYLSNIVEDSNRNLWMIADGKLYKLDLDN